MKPFVEVVFCRKVAPMSVQFRAAERVYLVFVAVIRYLSISPVFVAGWESVEVATSDSKSRFFLGGSEFIPAMSVNGVLTVLRVNVGIRGLHTRIWDLGPRSCIIL